MDGSTGKLMHIGAEVVVLLGVTFYLNTQIRSLKTEIRELRTKMEEDARESNKHLNSMYMVIDQLQKSRMLPFAEEPMHGGRVPHWMMHGPGPHQERKVLTEPVQPMQLRHRKPPSTAIAKTKAKAKVVQFQDEEAIPTDETSLDEELRDELKAIDDDNTDDLGDLEASDTADEHASYSKDEADDESPAPQTQGKKIVKAPEGPFSDLSFVQSAIRQVPRKQAPTHSNQKNA